MNRVSREFPELNACLAGRNGRLLRFLNNSVVLSLLLAAVYLLLGLFAFSMAVRNANITCQAFFPEGISLVCIILFGPRVAPGIFIGQFILAQWTGLPPGTSAIIGLVNSLEGILGGYLFWKWQISPRLNRPRDIAMLFVLCALILQPISATGGIVSQYFLSGLEPHRMLPVWLYWWAGNALGQMLVLPLALTWLSTPGHLKNKAEIRRALLVVSLYFVPVAIFVFGDWGENGPLYRLLIFAAFYLPLIWLAVQSRVFTVALANLLLTSPFLCLINAGPDLAIFFSNQNRHLCADIIILAGIVTSLLIAALWEQLNDRNAQLRQANLAREKLFSIIGHDLRAPIANLKMCLDALTSGVISQSQFSELQNDLRLGTDRVHITLQNLLEWGRFQSSSLQPRPEACDLREVADDAIQLLSLMAQEKEITVENRISPYSKVFADAYQIQSVMRNLLSNALKFTPRTGRVIFSAALDGRCWTVSIQDNGIGMDADRVVHLLDKGNEHLSTPGTDNEKGFGLGIQLCLEFIRANRGRLSVESAPERGTTFTFTLPKAEAESGTSAPRFA